MPLADKKLSKSLVEFKDSLTVREVQALIADKDLKTLQSSRPVNLQTWELLNDQFFTRRPEIMLRIYGFYSLVCDFAFTSRMTNVQHFSADSMIDAVGIEHIGAMENLESLGVGIYHLEGFGFLNQVTPRLKRLSLGRTKSDKPDLSPLSRFDSLEEIYIEGQKKNIEVLSQLEYLQDVTLRSISTSDIGYLRPLHRMWSLDIKLGGIDDLHAIEGMENIKYLELWQIRGLSDLDVVSSLVGLQFLFLQSLRRVTTLPSLNRLRKLRRVYMENMRGLGDVSSLESAPALEEFVHVNAHTMQPEDYIPLLRNPNLKRAAAGFGSDKKNNRFQELMREHNIEPLHDFREFEFV
jgi:hypothetical protein